MDYDNLNPLVFLPTLINVLSFNNKPINRIQLYFLLNL